MGSLYKPLVKTKPYTSILPIKFDHLHQLTNLWKNFMLSSPPFNCNALEFCLQPFSPSKQSSLTESSNHVCSFLHHSSHPPPLNQASIIYNFVFLHINISTILLIPLFQITFHFEKLLCPDKTSRVHHPMAFPPNFHIFCKSRYL